MSVRDVMPVAPLRPSPVYRYAASGATLDDKRPLIAIDVDGVIALDDPPLVPATAYQVTAWGKWRRTVTIADGTREVLRLLAEHCELAWATAWSYSAHQALADVLGLVAEPWTFIPLQFHPEGAIAQYAGDRPWAWITEAWYDKENEDSSEDGYRIIAVDPRRGLVSIDIARLLAALGAGEP